MGHVNFIMNLMKELCDDQVSVYSMCLFWNYLLLDGFFSSPGLSARHIIEIISDVSATVTQYICGDSTICILLL